MTVAAAPACEVLAGIEDLGLTPEGSVDASAEAAEAAGEGSAAGDATQEERAGDDASNPWDGGGGDGDAYSWGTDAADGGREADAAGPVFGPPVAVVSGENDPTGLTVTPGAIFWALKTRSVVRSAPRGTDGGASAAASDFASFINPSPGATDLVGDSTNLYALVGPLFNANGCQTVQVTSSVTPGGMGFCEAISSSAVVRVAIDSANVYLSGSIIVGPSPAPAIVYTAKPGIGVTPPGWSNFGSLASAPEAMASDGATLYYSLGSQIFGQPTVSGSAFLFARSSTSVTDLAVDGNQVYWITAGGGVYAASKTLPGDGGTASPVPLASGQNGPMRLAQDSANVYWTNQGDGSIAMAGKDGQGSTQVAMDQAMPYGIAVDRLGVYWSNTGDGSIMMAPFR